MFEETLRALGVPMLRDRAGRGPSPAGAPNGVNQDWSRTPYAPVSMAPGLLPAPKSWDAYAASPPARPPKERTGGMDIFIGGGLDDKMPGGGVMRGYADQYARETERPTRYLPNARVGHVVDAIRDGNADGGPVNVVGHSWGGPDAYDAVAAAHRAGYRVDNLVTLDPVSGPSGMVYPYRGPVGAETWINVRGAPSHPDFTDWITNRPPFSKKPSSLPIHDANRSVDVDLNHRDVDGMMRQSGARALLDASRQLPGVNAYDTSRQFAQPPSIRELHDNLPMMDWIRAREAQVGRTGAGGGLWTQ